MHAKATTFTLLLVGALVLESGCARWTNGNAGEKDMQPGLGRGGVSGGLSSGRGQAGGADDIPALSQLRRPDGSPLGTNSGEERIGNDTVTLSPSSSSGSRGGRFGEGLSPEERLRGERLATAAGLQDVFFQYNSAIFSNEARERLLHAASWLKGESKYRLLIEGHCDERGTNAYNLVLGEKRARAVQNFLRDQHLDAGRFSVVSYGKERPFCNAHDEVCYQENRRGHLVVQQ